MPALTFGFITQQASFGGSRLYNRPEVLLTQAAARHRQRVKRRDTLFTHVTDVRHDNKDATMRGRLRGVETRDGPADRYAVPGFHLQVAALSLKTGATLTCHLSDCTARPASALHTLTRNDQRGLTSGETQACSQCGAVVLASSNHGEIFRRLVQQKEKSLFSLET